MIVLRSVNHNSDARPDQLVAMRVFINDQLIVSTRRRKVFAVDEVLTDLENGNGPVNCGSWLVEVCDALTGHTSEFIEDLHDKIIELEDALLDQRIPPRGELGLLRKQLIVMRRYMAPQRDVLPGSPVRNCPGWTTVSAAACRRLPTGWGAAWTIWTRA